MKQQLLLWMNRVDALTLRERAIVFVSSTVAIIFLTYSLALNPLFAKQALLQAELAQAQNSSDNIDAAFTQKVQAATLDPDLVLRNQIKLANAEVAALGATMQAQQKGLVAPEKMVNLLNTMLRSNGHLRLIALTTLPVSGVSENGSAGAREAAKDKTDPLAPKPVKPASVEPGAVKGIDLLFKHGVEIVLQGNYVDMVNYMTTLETKPSQFFWANAKLDAQDYTAVRLTLTLYTLSLDQRWIKL